MNERKTNLIADGVIAPNLGDVNLIVLAEAARACLAERSRRRRSRQCSVSGGGIGVFASFFQSKIRRGYWASSVRRVASSNGSRPTFTPGGVRNQYNMRGGALPRLLG